MSSKLLSGIFLDSQVAGGEISYRSICRELGARFSVRQTTGGNLFGGG